jgi:hypothetical protein
MHYEGTQHTGKILITEILNGVLLCLLYNSVHLTNSSSIIVSIIIYNSERRLMKTENEQMPGKTYLHNCLWINRAE